MTREALAWWFTFTSGIATGAVVALIAMWLVLHENKER